jgi:hypothetical protein
MINLDTVLIILSAVLSLALFVVFLIGTRNSRLWVVRWLYTAFGSVALILVYTAYRRVDVLPIQTMPPGTAAASSAVFGLLDLVWAVGIVAMTYLFWFDRSMDAFIDKYLRGSGSPVK